jgi:serine/threonine-protein kinase RsbW
LHQGIAAALDRPNDFNLIVLPAKTRALPITLNFSLQPEGSAGKEIAQMGRSRLRILAVQRELRSVVSMVDTFCAENNIPSQISDIMKLVLDEVLSNIVAYAYNTPECGVIDVELTYSNNEFTATVEDDGKPFDPLQYPKPNIRAALKDRKQGGLGIYFVRNLVDNVAYHRVGSRNKLVLAKQVSYS